MLQFCAEIAWLILSYATPLATPPSSHASTVDLLTLVGTVVVSPPQQAPGLPVPRRDLWSKYRLMWPILAVHGALNAAPIAISLLDR